MIVETKCFNYSVEYISILPNRLWHKRSLLDVKVTDNR